MLGADRLSHFRKLKVFFHSRDLNLTRFLLDHKGKPVPLENPVSISRGSIYPLQALYNMNGVAELGSGEGVPTLSLPGGISLKTNRVCGTNLLRDSWLSSKESACDAVATGDLGSNPGSGRSPGEGNGSPLQYSCLENPRDREDRQVTVHGDAKNQTRLKRLSMHGDSCW